MKLTFLVAWLFGFLLSAAVSVGIIYAIVHFVKKFW